MTVVHSSGRRRPDLGPLTPGRPQQRVRGRVAVTSRALKKGEIFNASWPAAHLIPRPSRVRCHPGSSRRSPNCPSTCVNDKRGLRWTSNFQFGELRSVAAVAGGAESSFEVAGRLLVGERGHRTPPRLLGVAGGLGHVV